MTLAIVTDPPAVGVSRAIYPAVIVSPCGRTHRVPAIALAELQRVPAEFGDPQTRCGKFIEGDWGDAEDAAEPRPATEVLCGRCF